MVPCPVKHYMWIYLLQHILQVSYLILLVNLYKSVNKKETAQETPQPHWFLRYYIYYVVFLLICRKTQYIVKLLYKIPHKSIFVALYYPFFLSCCTHSLSTWADIKNWVVQNCTSIRYELSTLASGDGDPRSPDSSPLEVSRIFCRSLNFRPLVSVIKVLRRILHVIATDGL